ncbi:hypothetical protein C3Y87_17485 [Carbonactinospora thermoautotrophica]|uniref:hypothetical protein n=1 Tax=Carbonactinospora thermoautotrophica TaxID=1469144 RepID=UPI0022706930|nr:hypothetical protein [Carbonactinospora thermoautotrophica]MCX9193163.1 hypothetical protein [Carbonactinospora thermoautotrophica]
MIDTAKIRARAAEVAERCHTRNAYLPSADWLLTTVVPQLCDEIEQLRRQVAELEETAAHQAELLRLAGITPAPIPRIDENGGTEP